MKTASRFLAAVAALASLATAVACGGAPTDAEETGRTQEAMMCTVNCGTGGSSSSGGGSGSGSGGRAFSCTSYFNTLMGSSGTATSLNPLSNATSLLAAGSSYSYEGLGSPEFSCQPASTVNTDSALLTHGCYGGETFLLANGNDYYATTYLCPTSFAITSCEAAATGAANFVSVGVGLADGDTYTLPLTTTAGAVTNLCVGTEAVQCTPICNLTNGCSASNGESCETIYTASTPPSGWQFVTLTYVPPSGGRPGACGSACKVPLVP